MHQDLEGRIRDIWDHVGRSGDPGDHRLRAEHEMSGIAMKAADASGVTTTADTVADNLGGFA